MAKQDEKDKDIDKVVHIYHLDADVDNQNDDDNDEKKVLRDLRRTLRPINGYLFAFLAAISFCAANILVKKAHLLTGPDQLVILFLLKLILMVIMIKLKRVALLGPIGQRRWLTLRGIVGVLALLFLYTGLLFIPPSDCSAIANSGIILTAVLARIFLKEMFGFVHIFAIVLTVLGVVFISKPSILFPSSRIVHESNHFINETLDGLNETTSWTPTSPRLMNMHASNIFLFGILLVLAAALFFGIMQILMKKLCNENVFWGVNTIYAAYIGLPVSLLLSGTFYLIGWSHSNLDEEMPYLLEQIGFSSLSAVLAIAGQVFINIAMHYEDPTKVSIAKTTDVLFAFLFQYIFLDISVDVLSVIGSVAIVFGSFIVLSMKVVENQLLKSKSRTINTNILARCILKKF